MFYKRKIKTKKQAKKRKPDKRSRNVLIAMIITLFIAWGGLRAENNKILVVKRLYLPIEQTEQIKNELERQKNDIGIKEITAYNVGDINQTDDSPCISANGENICLALEKGYKRCATNFLPFGTLIEIENYGICMITDRTNKRYTDRIDIAMKKNEYQRAINFGIQKLNVIIIN
jgi:3D (Asp-Asp-Asp) domain-containing protein|tara:strand:- start:272 stop:793 length:522 start_codon:yes stop_codon:yes gene_type:complete